MDHRCISNMYYPVRQTITAMKNNNEALPQFPESDKKGTIWLLDVPFFFLFKTDGFIVDLLSPDISLFSSMVSCFKQSTIFNGLSWHKLSILFHY